MKNIILDEVDGVLYIDVSTPKHPDAVMLVDKDDWVSYTSEYTFRVMCSEHRGIRYCVSYPKGKSMFFHRFILPDSTQVDHVNHNGMDNRRSNIRSCTHAQNMMNRGLQANNKSGVTGVLWDKLTKKWRATIKIRGKNKYLGQFAEKSDAIACRKQAEENLFGEYSYNNSMEAV